MQIHLINSGPLPLKISNSRSLKKILVDKLAKIMPTITSMQQRGFIKERSIKDCICLTSETINVLSKKSHGEIFYMKVDIAKSFDTSD